MPNISRTKTWNANETLTASDLNAEFDGILTGVNNNALNADNLNTTDDYLLGTMVLGAGLAAGSADGKLHVHVASAGSVQAHANGNDFVIEGTANPGMSFLSGASTTNSIYFGDVNDNDVGSIVYTHGTDMAFTVETVEVLALAAADLTIAANVGLIFGDAGEKIEGDGTNLTVASSGLLTLTATGNTVITNNALVSGTLASTGAATLASLVCTAGATFGGGIGSTGVTISTAGVIQANGAITSDGAVTGATLAGTVSTATQNSITAATSLASVGTVTSGTWSTGAVIGGVTMTLGSDATGDVYYRNASNVLTRLAVGSDADVLTLASGVPSWATPTTGDITGVTAGVGLSGGGASGSVTLTLDLSELSAVTPASGDWFATLDSDGANEQLTTTDALATLFAGTGLTASSAVIGVDAAQTGITSLGTLTALTVDDVAINGKVITMTGSSSDTAVFTAGTNGTLSIVTTDAAAAAANIQITADGTVDIDSAGVLTLDSGAAINIEPASGSAILLDGTISIDAGVITGASAITLSGELDAGSLDVSGNGDIAGTLGVTGVTTHGGNVVSDTDSTDDLGTTSVRWKDLYIDSITCTDQITATGFTGTLDGILGSGAAAAATVTTLAAGGDVTIADGYGMVVGSTAQSNAGGITPEMQVLGTSGADSQLMLAMFNSGGGGPQLTFLKSRSSSIGSLAKVADDNAVGQIAAYADDGTDYVSAVGRIDINIDGATAENDTPGRITFSTTPDESNATTEAMRIDSAQKIYNRVDSTGYYTGAGDDTRLYFNATNAVLATAGALIFQTNGTTEAMRIDSVGRVGIGVTPPTWNTAYTEVVQIGRGSWSDYGSDQLDIGHNFYYSTGGAYTKIADDFATRYTQSNGQHVWVHAASGTGTFTWTEDMRLDASGNLGIGVVPRGTHADWTSLSFGGTGYISTNTAGAAGKSLYISQNSHLDTDGSDEYIFTDEASSYGQLNGTHIFKVVASGSAGADISWITGLQVAVNGAIKNPVDNAGYYTGAGDDVRWYYNGSSSLFDSVGSNIIASNTSVNLMKAGGAEDMLTATVDGAVTLFYDNAAKFATRSDGARCTGNLGSTGYVTATSGMYMGIAPGAENESYHYDSHSNGAGTGTQYIGNASINVTSDVRAKQNILDYSGSALDVLDEAKIVEFDYIPEMIADESEYGPSSRGRYVGLLAHEMKGWAPWAVNDGKGDRNGDHLWKAEYEHIVPLLVKAVQELRSELKKERLN
jgi:hypothetical protein